MDKQHNLHTRLSLLNKTNAADMGLSAVNPLSFLVAIFLFITSSSSVTANLLQTTEGNSTSVLSLVNAIQMAQTRDDWLVKSRFEQQRLTALSKGAAALPDPTLSVGLFNLPTDGFAFDQEPMTQLKVGASQMFGRGNSLALQTEQFKQTAAIQPVKRVDRQQKVAWQTTLLWLDAYESQASYDLVKEAEPLFDKLGDIVSAGYASSLGKANQQDLIRAELEFVRLKDRQISLSTAQRVAISKLTQFLSTPGKRNDIAVHYTLVGPFPSEQNALIHHENADLLLSERVNEYDLYTLLTGHPLVVAIEHQIIAENTGIEIAQQRYKPQFGVNASYALRDDAPAALGGNSRADFFSIGMSVSLPIFSTARQDGQVSSSIQQVEATKTEKRLVLRELMAGLKSSIDLYQGALQRLAIYNNQILPQMSQQSEAALNAYTNDSGDFAEVIRAKIAELDAQITSIGINVKKQKALAAIQYYLSQYKASEENREGITQSTGAKHNG